MVKSLLLALVSLTPALAQPIGVFESHSDIGVTPQTGSASFEKGAYRITGGGANIWAREDAFQFVWKKFSGGVRFTADVHFEGAGAVAHRKAVLMIRQDLTPGAAYADVALHGDGLASLQFRPTAGALTQEIRSTSNGPVRLRIERRGNSFTIAVGQPGEELVASAPQTVDLSGPVYLGLGVCSHDANILETAVFTNVSIEPLYRSKVTIYDTRSKTNRTVYTADQVVEAPNWSRDGKFLLVNTGGSLYHLPLDGAAQPTLEKLDLGAPYRCNNDHDLSKDGKLLAFSASTPESHGSQVYLANADGSNVRLMASTVPSYFHGWSPDSQYLAIVGQRNGHFELFRIPAAGGGEERLTSRGGYDDGPEYTPDGKWIYFNSDRSGKWEIYRMPPTGAGPDDAQAERITNDELENWFPHISPDGKTVVYLAFPKGTKTHNDKMPGVSLRLMRAPGKNGKTPQSTTAVTFFGGQGTINVNSWSPDSKKFAYVVYEPL